MDGLESFKKEKLSIKWKGSALWKTHGGSVDCYYDADIVIKATKALVVYEELSQALHQNPFLKTKDVGIFYEKSLKEYLDYEFEDFCTCDDYYQPVVEDFEIEYCVEEWCKKMVLNLSRARVMEVTAVMSRIQCVSGLSADLDDCSVSGKLFSPNYGKLLAVYKSIILTNIVQ